MAESSIPVDLLNPGQVFACLGLLEAADVLLGRAVAAFDWHNSAQTSFRVGAAGNDPPVGRVIDFLEEAEIVTRAPEGSPNVDRWNKGWGAEPTVDSTSEVFPFADPTSPATLPVLLRDHAGKELSVDYWGDSTKRDNVKFWAGSAGYPGSAILRDAINIVKGKMHQHASNPFALSGAQSNSFRFDWRRDYISVQDGFSPNKHKTIQMVGFPLVEILAAIGMSHARPKRIKKLEYDYGVIGDREGALVEPMFHRAALGSSSCPVPGTPFRRFTMQLDWPGRENDARCITQVTEKEIDE